jgi:predicted nucleic acid-binding protein
VAIFLLDTSVIIDALNGKQNRAQLFKELLQQGHLLACCSINVTEVSAGLRSHEDSRTRELPESLPHFPITFPVARLADLLKRDYGRKGISPGPGSVSVLKY